MAYSTDTRSDRLVVLRTTLAVGSPALAGGVVLADATPRDGRRTHHLRGGQSWPDQNVAATCPQGADAGIRRYPVTEAGW